MCESKVQVVVYCGEGVFVSLEAWHVIHAPLIGNRILKSGDGVEESFFFGWGSHGFHGDQSSATKLTTNEGGIIMIKSFYPPSLPHAHTQAINNDRSNACMCSHARQSRAETNWGRLGLNLLFGCLSICVLNTTFDLGWSHGALQRNAWPWSLLVFQTKPVSLHIHQLVRRCPNG